MATTRNIVPRVDGEGELGTSTKAWNEVNAKTVNATKIAADEIPYIDEKISEHNSTDDAHATLLHLRKASTAYTKGDIAYSTLLPSWAFLECTVAGTTDSAEITVSSSVAKGDTITDGTVTWKVDSLIAGDGVSIGMILPFAGNGDIPSGYLLCDGSLVSRTMYADLFSAIGTTYGEGDGSTTFALPNLTDKFIEGSATAGTEKEAGLPNIEGNITDTAQGLLNFDVGLSGRTYSGALIVSGSSTFSVGGSAAAGMSTTLDFDASKSNAIYGNSDTVQPPALTMRYIIKAFDGQTADSALIDVTQYADELNKKVNKSEADYVTETYTDDDGNWYRVYKSGWVEQGGQTTANTSAITVTLLKPYTNTNYTVSQATHYTSASGGVAYNTAIKTKTTTTITFSQYAAAGLYATWSCAGQGATE